jgi:hypothetical protein
MIASINDSFNGVVIQMVRGAVVHNLFAWELVGGEK